MHVGRYLIFLTVQMTKFKLLSKRVYVLGLLSFYCEFLEIESVLDLFLLWQFPFICVP